MPILRSSPASPFGRKVKIAAKLLGVWDRIELVNADTTDENDSLRLQNPLGKIPTLVLDDGTAIYDSRVIVEYLDTMAGGGTMIPQGPARFPVLTLQALGDGICDAALLQVYEGRYREADRQEPKWLAMQAGKVTRGLARLEADPPVWTGTPHVGIIAVACALGYLDLRFQGSWRQTHPALVVWLDRFAAAAPAFEETRFKG